MLNWKVRFRNKTFVAAFAAVVLNLIYYTLNMFEIVPKFTQNQIAEWVSMILEVLVLIGILVDPTVDGISDSSRAMGYEYPAINAIQEQEIKERK